MKEYDVHFGAVGESVPNWRMVRIEEDEKDDDEVLRPTPQGVIDMLGFDPLEFEDVEKGGPGSGSWEGPGDPRFEWEGSVPPPPEQEEIKELFHGTPAKNAAKIKREGIKGSWGLAGKGVYATDEAGAYSWGVTKWCQDHQKNPEEAGPSVKVAVIRLKPEGFKYAGVGDYLSEEDIPPEQILEVKTYLVRDYKKIKAQLGEKEDKLFLAILFDPTDIRSKGGEGSGSWDGPGQPRFDWTPKDKEKTPSSTSTSLTPEQREALELIAANFELNAKLMLTKEDLESDFIIKEKCEKANFTEEEIEELGRQLGEKFGTGRLAIKQAIDLDPQYGDETYNNLLNDPEGRLMNQFELFTELDIKKSNGSLGPMKGSGRDEWERDLFYDMLHQSPEYVDSPNWEKLSVDDARMRPKYGWLAGESNLSGQYGIVHLVYKPEVAERTTFTLGNSSSIQDIEDVENNPDRMAFQGSKRGIHALVRQAIKNEPIEIVRKRMRDGTVDKLNLDPTYGYLETQIFGSTTIKNDVKEIVVRPHLAGVASSRYGRDLHVPEIINRAKSIGAKFGVPVRILDEFEYI